MWVVSFIKGRPEVLERIQIHSLAIGDMVDEEKLNQIKEKFQAFVDAEKPQDWKLFEAEMGVELAISQYQKDGFCAVFDRIDNIAGTERRLFPVAGDSTTIEEALKVTFALRERPPLKELFKGALGCITVESGHLEGKIYFWKTPEKIYCYFDVQSYLGKIAPSGTLTVVECKKDRETVHLPLYFPELKNRLKSFTQKLLAFKKLPVLEDAELCDYDGKNNIAIVETENGLYVVAQTGIFETSFWNIKDLIGWGSFEL